MKCLQRLLVVCAGIVLVGCSGNGGFSDLDQYMAEMKSKPSGTVEPLPTFTPYKAFTYRASSLRSPFEPPVKLKVSNRELNSNVKPDKRRARQYLEQFDIESFALVGSISNDDGLWGLIRGDDGIHRVRVGDYLGKNHGRITHIDNSELRIIEIVPAGSDIWIERPRSLRLDLAQP